MDEPIRGWSRKQQRQRESFPSGHTSWSFAGSSTRSFTACISEMFFFVNSSSVQRHPSYGHIKYLLLQKIIGKKNLFMVMCLSSPLWMTASRIPSGPSAPRPRRG